MGQIEEKDVIWATLPRQFLYAFDQLKAAFLFLICAFFFLEYQDSSGHRFNIYAVSLKIFVVIAFITLIVALISQLYVFVGYNEGVCFCIGSKKNGEFVVRNTLCEFKYRDITECSVTELFQDVGVISITAVKIADVDLRTRCRNLRIKLDSTGTYIRRAQESDHSAIDQLRKGAFPSDARGTATRILMLIFMSQSSYPSGYLSKTVRFNIFCRKELCRLITGKVIDCGKEVTTLD